MGDVLAQMAKLCDKRELAVVAVEALSQGDEVVATAVLPLCDMDEVGPLAVGALAAANNEPFGEIARALARSLAQRHALGEHTSRALASSKPARL